MIHGPVRPSACLDPETLGTLAEGRLAGAERDAAVRHLAGCRRCHEVFASSVQILEAEGVLPVVRDAAPAPPARRPMMVWLSAAAAALVAAIVLIPRVPVEVPRVAQVSPTPAPPPAASPSAAVQTASMPPEAIEALRTLNGFASRYAAPPSAGFVPDHRGRAVATGMSDVDDAARALAAGAPPPELAGSIDDWRRLGWVLEASRLALLDPKGKPEAFFASPWARVELARASRLLREGHVRDATWVDDVAKGGIDGEAAQSLLERLDRLVAELR